MRPFRVGTTSNAKSMALRRVAAKFGCDAEGKLLACEVTASFDTGAYASWGPTVANRVPVHAMGPYAIANVRSWGEAFFTNGPPAGAFRSASANPGCWPAICSSRSHRS